VPTFLSKVPKLEDFQAPWEADGEDAEVDKTSAKKFIHGILVDKAKAQDAREAEKAKTAEVEAERDELQTKLEGKADPDLKAEIDKAKAAQAKAEGQRDEAVLAKDRVEIAVEKGLSPSQAKRLVGKNREELEADADELVKDLGIEPGKANDEDDEGDEGRITPRSRLNNGGDPLGGKGGADQPVDYEAAAASIQSNKLW
jgi:hypothetical protein